MKPTKSSAAATTAESPEATDRRRKRARLLGLVALLMMAVLASVWSHRSGGLYTVEGEVTLDGRPVAAALVVFQRETGGGPPAQAITDQAGHFRLSTFTTGDGVVPGLYKVTVAKYDERPPVEISAKPSDPGYREQMDKIQKASLTATPPRLLPAEYYEMKTTPLRQQVPPEGKVMLRLHSKAG